MKVKSAKCMVQKCRHSDFIAPPPKTTFKSAFPMFMFNKLWIKSFGTTRQVIDMVLGAPADLRFEHPAFAALAAMQLMLAVRARHTMGVIVGFLTSAILCLKYTSIDLAKLGLQVHIPQYARLALAAYVVVLLVVRLLTLKTSKGKMGTNTKPKQ
jgi:cbb3-type cytochrome oxidase subunit 1